ncbi:MAG: DUF3299 domain-containing protein [Burkholderiaceae bacterium]|nr:DUF3299 domain-containing protein [Burkholderiaceae bacterium]
MNTKLMALVLAAVLGAGSTSASAQLSAPIGGAPAGTGAGVHSPNSPFAPLPARADVVSWNVLTDVKTKTIKGSIVPQFNASQMALNQRSQRIQGFMMPLDPGEKQKHFLLSSVPLNCGFCTPGGPESMVEVKSKIPVKYSMEPVVVEGVFQVLVNDPFGVYYRIAEATPVK